MGLSVQRAPALDLPARFMALSVGSFAAAVASTPWTLPLLQESFSAFHLLAFVHLGTLGFVGAMLFGASYQLVPVVLQTPLASVRIGRFTFWCYVIGLALFLGGLWGSWLPGLSIGGSLLAVAFAGYIGVILVTWWRAPYHDAIGAHIVGAASRAGIGMALGAALAFNKSNGMLGGHLATILAAHIVLMLVGWVGVMLTGVAYRLVCMFTLAEKHYRPRWAWAELALTLGGGWVLAIRFAFDLPSGLGQVAALSILAGYALFAVHLVKLYRGRMRKAFDIHLPFMVSAVAFVLLAAAMLLVGLVRHTMPGDPWWVATTWIAIFGVAGTAIQGFFLKIASFLVWLKRYSPVAGKQPVPKLEQLSNRNIALAGLGFWLVGTIALVVALLADLPVRPVAPLLIAAGGCFVANVVRIASHWRDGDRLRLREPVVAARAAQGVRTRG